MENENKLCEESSEEYIWAYSTTWYQLSCVFSNTVFSPYGIQLHDTGDPTYPYFRKIQRGLGF
jgi:hypothetical protein